MALFGQGYNCAQSVLLAYADLLEPDRRTLARLASSFGGGMGRLREVCGALSGAFMAAGLLYGYEDPGDATAKAEHYRRIQEIAAGFRERCGSLICRELLGLTEQQDDPTPSPRTASYYEERPCMRLVGTAAALLDDYLAAHSPD
ncbi:MAG: C-GCAxxG-C-C family protein [Anaerovoracaceae bacterium]|jgi:C_GCAxxG_C_C family probable redox protein